MDKEIYFKLHEQAELIREFVKQLDSSTYESSGDRYATSEESPIISALLWKKIQQAAKENL